MRRAISRRIDRALSLADPRVVGRVALAGFIPVMTPSLRSLPTEGRFVAPVLTIGGPGDDLACSTWID